MVSKIVHTEEGDRDLSTNVRYVCDSMRHLVCEPYSIDGLHTMAADLGIKRCWFHNSKYPHYDIPKRRVEEIREKCEVVDPREILRIVKEAMRCSTEDDLSCQN